MFKKVPKTLSDQGENLKNELKQPEFVVLKIISEVASGWKEDRDGLKLAAEYALAKDAVLVAESVTRFIRNKDYNSKTNWKVPAHPKQIIDVYNVIRTV